DGTWEAKTPFLNVLGDMAGGTSALATLGLLEAGVPADDLSVAPAIKYLAGLPPKKTYVVSLQTQVLARADAKKHAEVIQRNADWLVAHALGLNAGGGLKGWSYGF